jgi:hypothetical protein
MASNSCKCGVFCILLLVSMPVFHGCQKPSPNGRLIDYVIQKRPDKDGQYTNRRDLYVVDSMGGYSWLKARIYSVKMPGIVHYPFFLVALSRDDSIFAVADPFEAAEVEFGAVVDGVAIRDSASVLQFLDFYQLVRSKKHLRFSILRSKEELPLEFRAYFLPLSITRSDSTWTIQFVSWARDPGMGRYEDRMDFNQLILNSRDGQVQMQSRIIEEWQK